MSYSLSCLLFWISFMNICIIGNSIDCQAGEYKINNTLCMKCELGRYAPQALTDSCLDCIPGFHTNNQTGATTCTSCMAGKYNNISSTICNDCDIGKYSSKSASTCTDCIKGFIAPIKGSSSCISCSIGKYEINLNNCSSCPVGKYQSSIGQSSCIDCDIGKYAASIESSICINCRSQYSSEKGSSICSIAEKGYLLTLSNQVISCPHHATCIGGSIPYPIPSEGYWIDRSLKEGKSSSSKVYKCTRDTCLGGNLNHSCWLNHLYNQTICQNEEIQCKKGSRGVLCGSCYFNYRYNSATNDCQHCEKGELSIQLSFSVVICFVLFSPFIFHYGRFLREKLHLKKSKFFDFLTYFDSGTLKVIWNTYQILVSATYTLDVIFPSPFSDMISFFSIFSLDFMGTDCMGNSRNVYYDTVYLWCCFPLGVGFIIIILGKLRIKLVQYIFNHEMMLSNNHLENMKSEEDETEEAKTNDENVENDENDINNVSSPQTIDMLQNRFNMSVKNVISSPTSSTIDMLQNTMTFTNVLRRMSTGVNGLNRVALHEQISKIKSQHMWLFLLLGYLVLPAVTSKQLQVFDCFQINGKGYLKSDTNIDCHSHEYLNFRSSIIFFIILYQLIPILWYYLLYEKREFLIIDVSLNFDENHAQFSRINNEALKALKFLFYDYKCNKWWFEIVDMYRRIIFLGILPLVSHRADIRASFGCILSMLSVAYFREEQPYRVEFTNVISHIAQYCILITFYFALSIESNAMINFGLQGVRLGYFLICSNLLILILSFRYAWKCFRKEQITLEIKEYLAIKNEDARWFTKEKFKTTFDFIWLKSVPSSHVLVYYYTTCEYAKRCRKSGIPANIRYGGIPLTLRPPHDTTCNDNEIFNLNHHDDENIKKLKQLKNDDKRDSNELKMNESIDVEDIVSNNEFSPKKNQSLEEEKNDSPKITQFPNEEVLVLSLPREFLDPLPGYEQDDALCMISCQVLNAMRPTSFTAVVDSRPWLDGLCMLPPQNILRSYWILDHSFSPRHVVEHLLHLDHHWNLKHNNSNTKTLNHVIRDIPLKNKNNINCRFLTAIHQFSNAMKDIRMKADQYELVPLYHYTSLASAQLILKSGFRMSTQGQGDGGVYVSTQGPASYGFGTSSYESNIIKDCFGIERIDEYLGRGLLCVVIVYGCEMDIFEQTPGGRENAKMVNKSTFRSFSFPHHDGNYFLRPDRILGCFELDDENLPFRNKQSEFQLTNERLYDFQSIDKIKKSELKLKNNFNRISKELIKLRPPVSLLNTSAQEEQEKFHRNRRSTFKNRRQSTRQSSFKTKAKTRLSARFSMRAHPLNKILPHIDHDNDVRSSSVPRSPRRSTNRSIDQVYINTGKRAISSESVVPGRRRSANRSADHTYINAGTRAVSGNDVVPDDTELVKKMSKRQQSLDDIL